MALTVVVAEDEALIRMDLVELLRECGYDVVGQAADGQAAVDAVRRLRPDVVFLDVAMPVRDGLSAAEEIAADNLAPIVMVTAFAQRETIERAAAAGVLGYLVKPFGKADLAPAIEVAVARWQQVQDLTSQVADLRERQQARATVEAAKRRIESDLGLSEPEAFAWLRRTAMDRRVTLAEVAAQIVEESRQDP